MDKNKKVGPVKRYFLGVALALDQLLSAIRGWDHDETVSSVLGKMEEHERAGGRKMRPIPKVVSRALNGIDEDHCREAIERDEGKNAIADSYLRNNSAIRGKRW